MIPVMIDMKIYVLENFIFFLSRSIFVRPKSTASAVSTKSILKAPKLSVVSEDDENETSNDEEERPELRVEFDCIDGVTFGPLRSQNDENELVRNIYLINSEIGS